MLNTMKLKVVAGVLVAFLAGMLLGGLGTTGYIFHGMRQLSEGSNTLRHRGLMHRLSRQLNITEEQKPDVQRILDESEQEISRLLQDSLVEFTAIMERQKEALNTVLTPEQQAKLEKNFRRLRSHWMPEQLLHE